MAMGRIPPSGLEIGSSDELVKSLRSVEDVMPFKMHSSNVDRTEKQSRSSESMMGRRCSIVRPDGPGVAEVQCFRITDDKTARSMLRKYGALSGRCVAKTEGGGDGWSARRR